MSRPVRKPVRRKVSPVEPWEQLLGQAWRRLLTAEKQRRGVGRRQLVFVGLHNVADVWWCAARAVRKAREREPSFFLAYLRDRVAYALELGRIRQLPRRLEDWLKVADNLTLDDANALLSRRRPTEQADPCAGQMIDGVLYVDPSLPADKREWCADWAERMGWRLAGADEDSAIWRQMVQDNRAERYPTIRWSFSWGPYVLVGLPDGLTDRFAYEFKMARSADVARRFVKPVASAQADLYGLFFRRPDKRVQIYATANGQTLTLDEPVNAARATESLEMFRAVDAGGSATPPAAWKCAPGRCDYFATCPVRNRASPGPSEARSPKAV